MRYLLDTNIIIYCLEQIGNFKNVLKHFVETPATSIQIPAVVLAEIEYGCAKSKDYKTNIARYNKFIDTFLVTDFSEKAARVYGKLRSELEKQGKPIGANDLLIASMAIAENCVLVTHNTKEFSRIPNLMIEDWTE